MTEKMKRGRPPICKAPKTKRNAVIPPSPAPLVPPRKTKRKPYKLDPKKFCVDLSRGLSVPEATAKQKLDKSTGYRYLKSTGVKLEALQDYKKNRMSYADVDVLLTNNYLRDVLASRPSVKVLSAVDPLIHGKITSFVAKAYVDVDKIARLEAGKPTEGISLRDARDRLVDMMTEAQGRLEELEVGSVVVEVEPVKEDIEPK